MAGVRSCCGSSIRNEISYKNHFMTIKTKSIAGKRLKAPAQKGPQQHAGRVRTVAGSPGPKAGKHAPGKNGAGPKPRSQETTTTKFTFYANPILALVCVPSDARVLFSLEDAAHLTGVHPEMLRYYSRVGLIEAPRGVFGPDLIFDESGLQAIRRIEHYRRNLGVGRVALPLVCEMQREGERRQIEIHFLRYP